MNKNTEEGKMQEGEETGRRKDRRKSRNTEHGTRNTEYGNTGIQEYKNTGIRNNKINASKENVGSDDMSGRVDR